MDALSASEKVELRDDAVLTEQIGHYEYQTAQDLEDPSACTEEELFAALPEFAGWVNGLSEMKLYKSPTQSLNFAADDSAISNHLEQAALEEEVERLALDDESSDDGLGGSNEDDSE